MADDGIKVICAGWGRTGTTSLKLALEILGYPTYHMTDAIMLQHGPLWLEAARNKAFDYNRIFNSQRKFHAAVDVPAAKYWREILQQYPQAKVILTERDPEKWYKSCVETVFRIGASSHRPFGIKFWLWSWLSPPKHKQMLDLVGELEYSGDWSKENVIRCFLAHNERVKAECSSSELLIYDVSQSWEPLCRYLNKPIPNVPFPHANDTKEMQKIIWLFNTVGYVAFGALLALPIGVSWFLKKILAL